MVGHPSLPDHADVEASAGRPGGPGKQCGIPTLPYLPAYACMHARCGSIRRAGGLQLEIAIGCDLG